MADEPISNAGFGASFYGQGTILKGPQGVPGKDGAQGIPGPTGPQGPGPTPSQLNEAASVALAANPPPKGDTGPTGPAGTITVRYVTKGDAASVVNAGTPQAAVLDFVLPKGDQGPQGATGPQGPTGPKGADGSTDAVTFAGQLPSYYTNITARLGYTPISKGGDAVTNVVSFLTAENTPQASRPNGSTPLEVRGNGTGPALMTFHRPNSFASFLGLDTDNKLKWGGWSAGAAAYELFHYGNDGAGSGQDADTVDGYHASSFARVDAGAGVSFTGGVTAPYLRSLGTANIDGVLTANAYVLRDVHLAEKHVEFTRGGQTAYFYATGSAVGLYDTQYGGIWQWAYGSPMAIQGVVAWTANTDGAGSGCDADTVDGLHASEFLRSTAGAWISDSGGQARFLFAADNSYYRSPNGHIFRNGSDTGVASIDSAGSAWFAGNVTAFSDRRLKSDIQPLTGAGEIVSRLNGYRYVMNGQRSVGVIAQELREVLPELVMEADDDRKTLSVAYGNLTAVLIEAVKDLQAQVASLKEQIA